MTDYVPIPQQIPMQEQQDSVPLQIIIDDSTNWQRFLDETVKFDLLDGYDKAWADICGGTEVPLLTMLRKEAEVNGTSFERCVINALLNRGFVLEELEFHSRNGYDELVSWGTCVWYKEHPSYQEPLDEAWVKVDQKWKSFIRSVFKTENSGDQVGSLFSMQMFAAILTGQPRVMLNKTFVFHRAVFSSPKGEPIAPVS